MLRFGALPFLLVAPPAFAKEEIVITGRGLEAGIGESVFDT